MAEALSISDKKSPICVLMSGGIDSAVMLVNLVRSGRKVVPVYVRCGLRWERAELGFTKRFLRKVRLQNKSRVSALEVIDMPVKSVYGIHWSIQGRSIPSATSSNKELYLPGKI